VAERRLQLLVALLLASAVALAALLAGPAGAKLSFRKVASKELEAKDERSVKAKCSSGARRHLISGGFASQSPLTEGARSTIAAFRSAPIGAREWKLTAANFESDPAKVSASVLCSKSDPEVRVRSTRVDAPAGRETKAVARCHKREEAIAGGFSAPESKIGKKKPEVIAVESRRSAPRKWRVVAYNNAGDADGELKAFVRCSRQRPGLETVEVEGVAVDQAPVELRPRCPRGEQLWSGGFVGSFDSFEPFAAIVADSSYANGRRWVSRFVGYQAGGRIKAFAYCRPGA
jgi:hypothetical protein